ncbi:site-specific integrase [Allokutzneria sp. A3M-2-11 16]|uniref:tyrosine-type recombinase/integrase n=1 Tax=Allokutzneria sp. A3M-2-11 16 TaxID=2962043 RepID=UPI0020B85617|nr:tyrosine-type recombinase/integrase [Allokutzneria sp. A3M-2-11 16]MCP3798474.1 site-specific integrase [Allokutzneria sp. A3M-2-11 16]
MAWTEQIGIQSWRVRYRTGDGHTASISGFTTKLVADTCAARINNKAHPSQPDAPQSTVTLAEWVAAWFTALDLDPRTIDNYRSRLRCHILLRWGTTPLSAITTLGINKWIIDLRQLGYANTTIASIIKLLSMILTDATDEGLIPANPIHRRRRRGRRSHRVPAEKVWATPTEVLRIADQAAALGGETAGLLIITAAWTGCRWGELTGLHRDNVDLHRGTITIDPRTGALHESSHTRWLGSPKTASSARVITLPAFLITLLRRHFERHDNEFVFTTESGNWLWRSTFIRRVLKPAVNGNENEPRARVRTVPVRPGLTFHGLRHSHKT